MIENIMPKTNQSNFKVMLKNLLLASVIFIAENCWASSTMPPPANLDAYLEKSNVLIFQGRFERVAYLARSLNGVISFPVQIFPLADPGLPLVC